MQKASVKPAVAVLGATGSIGSAALDVLQELGLPWHAHTVSAHSSIRELANIAHATDARYAIVTDANAAKSLDQAQFPRGCALRCGPEALVEIVQSPEIDTVIAAIVGSAGLMSTLAAAQSGKRIALANKEALVVAGGLVTQAVQNSGGEIIPVDSEHSAIFQALQGSKPSDVQRIILTASGGPFRTWRQSQLASARVEDALAHPTWQMGPKITIDSATMMNKALEVIEARWLFDLPADKIQVVIHPQSIIHSMVEFVDGSVFAQLSPPDMRLPIQYALTYPDRNPCPCPKMDWTQSATLELEPVDTDKFPAIDLGWEVAKRGGTCGAVLNAANEAAVGHFLNAQIKFTEIVAGCRRILDEHNFDPNPTLDELMRLDRWAREEIDRWVALC